MSIFIIAIVVVIASGCISIWDSTHINTVNDQKVIELQQQQLISKEGTTIRYLIITESETFICENSLINGKFDNSNLFWHLKKDSVYSFKVAGIGKTVITDYRNVIEVIN